MITVCIILGVIGAVIGGVYLLGKWTSDSIEAVWDLDTEFDFEEDESYLS